MADKEKKKKESIFDLSKYIDKMIRVKFQGGREASGVLKGFDPLLNLVLDGTIEYMRGKFNSVYLYSANSQHMSSLGTSQKPGINMCIYAKLHMKSHAFGWV
ncbi:hypothetical protein XENOCAPTIV_003850 [Xenoophorus captivus]|uniref:Sm domain-containing protein n=1 Tax=Xenoophorus captivus TaxID=1517983 RepID=A0ABV0RAN5_9TELE